MTEANLNEPFPCLLERAGKSPVRGQLTVPTRTKSGRLELFEEVDEFFAEVDPYFEPFPVTLLDGPAGRQACLSKCFLIQHQANMPYPAPIPMTVLVGQAIIGDDHESVDVTEAQIVSSGLLGYMHPRAVELTDVGRTGSAYKARSNFDVGDKQIEVGERLTVEAGEDDALFRWTGVLKLSGGTPSTFYERALRLNELLLLFSFLLDRPLEQDEVKSGTPAKQLFLTWGSNHAPLNTEPLVDAIYLDAHLPEMVGRWLDLLEDQRQLVQIAMGYQTRREQFSHEERALQLFRCVELFHSYSNALESVVHEKKAHKARVDAMLKDCPKVEEEDKSWIRSALIESNRKRLREQVKDVVEYVGPDIASACEISDPGEFADVVKSSRNYFTHPSASRPSQVPDGRDLGILVNRLWFLVRSLLLLELGVPKSQIVTYLDRSKTRHYYFS